MAATETINVRMEGTLKDHGMQVLERNKVSVSDAIRRLFEHLENEQTVPDWMQDDVREKASEKRAHLREMVGRLKDLPERGAQSDPIEDYRRHLVEKHCFEGIRE